MPTKLVRGGERRRTQQRPGKNVIGVLLHPEVGGNLYYHVMKNREQRLAKSNEKYLALQAELILWDPSGARLVKRLQVQNRARVEDGQNANVVSCRK